MTATLELARLWTLRMSAALAFIVNAGFYCFLLRRSLSQNIHWFLCNFVISELIRATTTLIDTVRWEMQLIDDSSWNETVYNRNDSLLTEIRRMGAKESFLLTVLKIARPTMDQVIAICMMTTCIFGLLILIQFYYYIKSPWANNDESFDTRSIGVVMGVWIGSAAYVVFVTVVTLVDDLELIGYNYDGIVSSILTSLYMLSSFLLIYNAYRLFYVIRIELYCFSNSLSFNERSLEVISEQRQRGVRYLLIFIFCLLVPVISIWFSSIATFIVQIRRHFMALLCLTHFASAYTFVFGSVWLFLWARLDADLGREMRRTFRISTKFPPRIDVALIKCEPLKQSKDSLQRTAYTLEERML